jgi:hypothetical protein
VTDETDDTVRLNGPRVGERTGFARTLPYAAATIVLAAVAGAGAWWSLRPEAVPPAQQLAMAPPAVPALPQAPPVPAVSQAPAPPTPPAVPLPPLATEAQILADAPEQTTIYRFAPQPAVIVVQFPNLREQATMLNRVAALIEKDGFPRDRVLDHAELDTRIRAAGVTPDTFYYGHDYRSADITRFFAIATGLNGDEGRLRNLIAQLGWREHGALGALISLVRENSNTGLDASARATILRHELSHGVYFTEPAYVQYCYHFWRDVLTQGERTLFTGFLQKEGYDPTLEDLIVNETQAYLVHTRDPRFFRAIDVGLTQERVDELRRIFVAGMPPGWLRDADTVEQQAPPALTPVRAP